VARALGASRWAWSAILFGLGTVVVFAALAHDIIAT
jgi:hypothetical protein